MTQIAEYLREFRIVYLGALLANKCEEEKEIQMRLMEVDKCATVKYHLLRAKHLSQTKKVRVYKTILGPALYAYKTWVLNKKIAETR